MVGLPERSMIRSTSNHRRMMHSAAIDSGRPAIWHDQVSLIERLGQIPEVVVGADRIDGARVHSD
jgi:hypothetical protein